MQFLLTEKEYSDLLRRAEKGDKLPNKEDLQELCTKAANSIILESGWMKGKTWGCILTEEGEWYCDDCPAGKVCPYLHKEYSK